MIYMHRLSIAIGKCFNRIVFAYFRLMISLKINPASLTDGVILYAAQNHQGIGQFMSVTLKNRQVEFRYTVAGMLKIYNRQSSVNYKFTYFF